MASKIYQRLGVVHVILGCLLLVKCGEYPNFTQILLEDYQNVQVSQVNAKQILTNQELLNFWLRDESNASEECKSQIQMLIEADLLDTMTDAWSKFYPGMMKYASKFELGNYDQCMSIDYTGTVGRVIGKYCIAGMIIPTKINTSEPIDVIIQDILIYGLKMATCIPDKCTAADIGNLRVGIFYDGLCTTADDNTQLDAGAIVTIVIIGVVVLLMIGQTGYDIFLHSTKKKPINPYIVAFSVYSNGKKLFTTAKKGGDQILCFNGLRAISMVWIVSFHEAVGWQAMPTTYENAYSEWVNSRDSQYLITGKYAVDTFFFLSGFLMAYQYFQSEFKKPVVVQLTSVPIMIIHRYLRLTPAVLMLFLYVTYLSRFLGSGPAFNLTQQHGIQQCKDNWWAFFLYIQNYHNPDNLCITPTWYLSADMQLFLFAIPVTIALAVLYRINFMYVMAALLGGNVIFLIVPIFTKLYLTKDQNPTLQDEFDSHSRLIAYFIGFMFGIFIRKSKSNLRKHNTKLNLLIWAVVLVVMFMITYVNHGIQIWSEYEAKAISISLARPLWCICLVWIVYSCIVGQGGIVNWFLSCGVMQVGAKLSYCLYLLHGTVIGFLLMQTRTTKHFSKYAMFNNFCGHLITSVVVSTFWTLAFESPLMVLTRALLKGVKKKVAPNAPNKRFSDARIEASKSDVSTA